MRFCLLVPFLILAGMALGQPAFVKVYEVTQADGQVLIMGENRGFVPWTIDLHADLVHMQSSIVLPAKVVMLPSPLARVMVALTPDLSKAYSYRYSSRNWQLGMYTGRSADTSYVYKPPYQKCSPCKSLYSSSSEGIPDSSSSEVHTAIPTRNVYFFSLPADTPIRAVRAGIIATIKEDSKSKNGKRANYIIIYHEDGTYAWYQNMKQEAATVKIGQWVAVGQAIGFLALDKSQKPLPLYLTILQPGNTKAEELRVRFE